MREANRCDSETKLRVLDTINFSEELVESRDDAGKLFDLLGKLWDCTEEMPEQERQKLITYVEDFCGPYQGEHDIVTYAQAARFARPLLKDILEP
jgi:hypothetical protein